MTDPVRQALRDLILQFGHSVCDEPKRCKGLLYDRCPEHRREVFLLISALEEHVVADLRQRRDGQAWNAIIARLSRRLVDHRGLAEGYARWAAESWALALGLIEETSLRPVACSIFQAAPRPPAGTVPMKPIPAGEFWMGSSNTDPEAGINEKPRHRVWISRSFYLGITPVTQAQYEAVMGVTPSNFGGQADNPVEQVSWYDAVQFCNELSRKEGLAPYYAVDGNRTSIAGGSGYRLPTEAEWECACRAGTEGRYFFGDGAAELGEHAWYRDNSRRRTQPVGRKCPNAWGLFDMHGNVWEWCEDWYDADYYRSSPGIDPPGGSNAVSRVIRGGSWFNVSLYVRAASRDFFAPAGRLNYLGFRVARG